MSCPIVVIGAHTLLGSQLIERLEADPAIQHYGVIDLHPLKKRKLKKLQFFRIDLTQPGADALMADQFAEWKPQTIVHSALKNNPSYSASSDAHELEVIGTVNILNAVKAAAIKKFVLCSTTMVYGASPKNPNYISENAPLIQHSETQFVRDKVEAEKQVLQFAKDCPAITVTTLRFCTIVGPQTENYFTALLSRPLVPTLLGYDPLMQFVHEEDALRALHLAIQEDHAGVFNIVGKGVIPLSYALREAGRLNIPIASFVAYPLIQGLWNFQLSAVPGKLFDYFRFLWVADGAKAQRLMKFTPQFSSKEAFIEMAKTRRIQEFKWASSDL